MDSTGKMSLGPCLGGTSKFENNLGDMDNITDAVSFICSLMYDNF